MSDAKALFEAFHGRPPSRNEIAMLKQEPAGGEECLEVGQLFGVMYKVTGIPEPYLHKFNPRSRPLLFVTANGRQMIVLNGKYRFTDRGFIG